MKRCWPVLFGLLLLVVPRSAAAGHGYGGYVDPLSLGQQARAEVDADGNLDILLQEVKPIYETHYVEEQRTREVEVDGKFRTESYTVKVPVLQSKLIPIKRVAKLPADRAEAYHLNGTKATADELRERLAERSTVLVASQQVPSYYLTIYKPGTLLVVVQPQHWRYVPMNGAGPGAYAPSANATSNAPFFVAAQAPVAVQPPAAEDQAGPKDEFGLAGAQPSVQLARWSGDKIALRTYLQDVEKQTTTVTIEQDGKRVQIASEIETDSVTDIRRTYHPVAVKFARTDKQPLTDNQLKSLLSRERAVLVAADSQPVDPSFLEIVRPDALVAVVPAIQPQMMFAPVPVPMPPPVIAAPPPPQ